eukprot:tig00020710_g13371.t1
MMRTMSVMPAHMRTVHVYVGLRMRGAGRRRRPPRLSSAPAAAAGPRAVSSLAAALAPAFSFRIPSAPISTRPSSLAVRRSAPPARPPARPHAHALRLSAACRFLREPAALPEGLEPGSVDLILCNPPWMPGPAPSRIDSSVFAGGLEGGPDLLEAVLQARAPCRTPLPASSLA